MLRAMLRSWRRSLVSVLSLALLALGCEAKVAKLDSNTFAHAVSGSGSNSIVMFYAPW